MIDTAQKRFSMLNFGWTPGIMLFESDGAVDTDDRSMLLHLYSGITLDPPSGATAENSYLTLLGVG